MDMTSTLARALEHQRSMYGLMKMLPEPHEPKTFLSITSGVNTGDFKSCSVDAPLAGLGKREIELWVFGTSQIHARMCRLIAESSRHINMVDGDWRPRCFKLCY